MDFLIGCDPELFVYNETKHNFIPGCGLVEGTKENPQKVENGAVQVDGLALELNITPTNNVDVFIDRVFSVKNQLEDMINKDSKDRLSLVAKPTVFFDKVWDSIPEEAKILGCDPDFNAWGNSKQNDKPDNKVKFRTGAGHIHIGWSKDEDVKDPFHIETCAHIVRQLDSTVGIMSLFKDEDKFRRKLYGKPGAFRPKPYGVEYRTLSNYWLNSKEDTKTVFNNTVKALEDLINGKVYVENYDINSINDLFNLNVENLLQNNKNCFKHLIECGYKK